MSPDEIIPGDDGEDAPITPPSSAERNPAANKQRDDETAAITRTIQPKSDSHSRDGIMGSGSGADTQQS